MCRHCMYKQTLKSTLYVKTIEAAGLIQPRTELLSVCLQSLKQLRNSDSNFSDRKQPT